jgi:hypothetical protein
VKRFRIRRSDKMKTPNLIDKHVGSR